MIARRELPNAYKRLLQRSETFTLAEAVTAFERCYTESRIDNAGNDGLVLLSDVSKDEPGLMQVSLHRCVDFFSQLSISLVYRRGLRSFLSPSTTLSCSEIAESVDFFSEVRASWVYWLFSRTQPIRIKIDFQDADDIPDEFYERMAPVFAEM